MSLLQEIGTIVQIVIIESQYYYNFIDIKNKIILEYDFTTMNSLFFLVILFFKRYIFSECNPPF